jgi:class 3 adenylate cyclase
MNHCDPSFDIADSTALTERLGDTAFRARARDLDATLRTIIRDNAGTAIEGKLLGDGVLAVFTSARQAIASREAGIPSAVGVRSSQLRRVGRTTTLSA